jgi:hypothetical protein
MADVAARRNTPKGAAMAVTIRDFPDLPRRRYDDLRPELQTGDLLLCSGSGVFAKLIQKASNSVWSHVGFVLRLDEIDCVMVLESVESMGVRCVPLSHYVDGYGGFRKGYPGRVLVARHKGFAETVTAEKLHDMAQFAFSLCGQRYDTQDLLRLTARVGRGIFGCTDEQAKQGQEYLSSEFAWRCYRACGIRIEYDERSFLAPRDFAKSAEVVGIAEIRL